MSTKLYDGMRIKNANIKEVKEKLLHLKKYFQEKMLKDIKLKLTSEYYGYVDNIFNTDIEETPYERTQRIFEFEVKKLINKKNSFLLSISFTIFIKQFKNDVYIYSFQREDNYKKELMELLPEIEDYFYYDNSDKPEDISQSHWDKREKNWNDVYDRYTFEESGFEKLEMVNQAVLEGEKFNYNLLLNRDIEKRIDVGIKNIYISVAYQKIIKGLKKEEISHSMYMSALNQYIYNRDNDLVVEIESHLRNNMRLVNENNFYTIKSLDKVKFKKDIEIKED